MNNTKKSNNASGKGACPLVKIVGATLVLTLFLFFCTHGNAFASADTLQNKLILTNDSGFVTKKEGLAFLVANSLIDNFKDKSDIGDNVNSTDTIGKYYRMVNSRNYIICLLLKFGQTYLPFIIEITPNGDLVKSEFLWELTFPVEYKPYNNFFMCSDFFVFTTYGAYGFGERACYGIYLFKDILLPRDSITYISRSCLEDIPNHKYINAKKHNFDNVKAKCYTSSMKIKKGGLIFYYTLREGKRISNENGKYYSYEFHKIKKKLTIKYHYENGKWNTNDTNKLKKLKHFIWS